MIFDALLQYLHHNLKHGPKALMVEKVKDELMIMGFLSFIITMMLQIDAHLWTHDQFIKFEFAHILLFFVSIVLVVWATKLMSILSKQKRIWENIDSESYLSANAETHRADVNALKRYEASSIWRLINSFGITGKVQQCAAFHTAKMVFFEMHDLPMSFDFPKYLRMHLSHAVTELLEVRPATHCTLIVVLLLNMGRSHLFSSSDTTWKASFKKINGEYTRVNERARRPDIDFGGYDAWVFIAAGFGLLVFDIVIAILGSRIRSNYEAKIDALTTSTGASLDRPSRLESARKFYLQRKEERVYDEANARERYKSVQYDGTKISRSLTHHPLPPQELDISPLYPFGRPGVFDYALRTTCVLHCYHTALF